MQDAIKAAFLTRSSLDIVSLELPPKQLQRTDFPWTSIVTTKPVNRADSENAKTIPNCVACPPIADIDPATYSAPMTPNATYLLSGSWRFMDCDIDRSKS